MCRWCVHCARAVLVLVGEPHVGYGLPVTCQRLYVAVVLGVEGMALYTVIQREGAVERFLVARCARQLRHAVDGESDGIRLLFGVLRCAVGIEAPVHAAILLVYKMVDDVVLCAQSGVKVFFVAEHTVGSGKRPQYAGVENGALLGVSHKMVVAVDASVETATLTVDHTVEPESQYVVGETLVHLLFHCFHCYCCFFANVRLFVT